MALKENIKHLLRRLVHIRYLGRLIRIAAAVWRGPAMYEKINHMERVYAGNLHTLLDTASRLNHVQLAHDNMIQSAPIALRDLRRDLSDLQEKVRAIDLIYSNKLQGLLETASQLNHVQLALDNLVQSAPIALRDLRRDITSLQEKSQAVDLICSEKQQVLLEIVTNLNQLRLDHDSLVDAVPVDLRDLCSDVISIKSTLSSHASSLEYLFGRVEFVRRELMFEFRYGARSLVAAGDVLEITPKVVAESKYSLAKANIIRINLGCGHIPLDGYLNVDRRELPHVDIVAEIDNLPFTEGEVAEIFSAHMLEHFPQEQLRRELLPYWKSLLIPNGVFRAVVPDAEAMLREYTAGAYPYADMREVIYGAQDYDGDFHYNMFTPEHLSSLLIEAGFSQVNIIAAGRKNGKCFEFEISAVAI
ncbi:hypothetical protein FK216_05345 [Moraxellaceae bacterium AER2_44_116]|nr:hypothetical protein [Moraxellaceae bacterium]TQC98942.1 hypothetical protein FK216_05345 [Moraxellaceae bacterium AER2_44_116]